MSDIRAGAALGAIAALFALASSLEFQTEQAIAQERKTDQYARIYSRRCMQHGKDWIAKQADSSNARWEVHCTKPVRA